MLRPSFVMASDYFDIHIYSIIRDEELFLDSVNHKASESKGQDYQSRDLGGRHVYNLSSALIKGARAKSIYFIVGVLLALSTFVFGYYPSDDL